MDKDDWNLQTDIDLMRLSAESNYVQLRDLDAKDERIEEFTELVKANISVPIEITDAMVERARVAFTMPVTTRVSVNEGASFTVDAMAAAIRAALEAAING